MAGEGKPPGWLGRAMGDTPRFLRTRVWIGALAPGGAAMVTLVPLILQLGGPPSVRRAAGLHSAAVGLYLALTVVYVALMLRYWRRLRARLAAAGGLLCWGCGFDLSRTPSPGRCPECGEGFEAGSLHARWARAPWQWRMPT